MKQKNKVYSRHHRSQKLILVLTFLELLKKLFKNSSFLSAKQSYLKDLKNEISDLQNQIADLQKQRKILSDATTNKLSASKDLVFDLVKENNYKKAKKEVVNFLSEEKEKGEQSEGIFLLEKSVEKELDEKITVLNDFLKEHPYLKEYNNPSAEERIMGYILNNAGTYSRIVLSGDTPLTTNLLRLRSEIFFSNLTNCREDDRKQMKLQETIIVRLLKLIPEFDLNKIIYLIVLFDLIYRDDLYFVPRNYRIGIADQLFSQCVINGDIWCGYDYKDVLYVENLQKWLCEKLPMEDLISDPIFQIYSEVDSTRYTKKTMNNFKGGPSFVNQIIQYILFVQQELSKV